MIFLYFVNLSAGVILHKFAHMLLAKANKKRTGFPVLSAFHWNLPLGNTAQRASGTLHGIAFTLRNRPRGFRESD